MVGLEEVVQLMLQSGIAVVAVGTLAVVEVSMVKTHAFSGAVADLSILEVIKQIFWGMAEWMVW